MKIVTTTYIRWEETGQTQAIVTGHDSCGFGGWSKCTIYGIQHLYVRSIFIDKISNDFLFLDQRLTSPMVTNWFLILKIVDVLTII